MKNIFLFTVLWFLALHAEAKHWTVSNNSSDSSNFNSLAQALNNESVQSGDTLIIYPSTQNYRGVQLTKSLVLMSNESEMGCMPTISFLTFNSGANGSRIMQLHVQQVQYNIASQSVVWHNCIIKPFLSKSLNQYRKNLPFNESKEKQGRCDERLHGVYSL